MNAKQRVQVSKFLSKHLRHAPEALGLSLEPGGWVDVDTLLTACRRNGVFLTREDLEGLVEENDKQRFAFDETGTRIRANQGHSIEIDLQLQPASPPAVLYHGTSTDTLDSIRQTGLLKMRRHHVHLSTTVSTAQKVGSRHGKPVVLVVDAERMCQDGHTFYCSANGVWLVEAVPPEYLRII